jgi:hypothetical protein
MVIELALLAVAVVLSVPRHALGTPSGLNNIPTTDLAEEGVLVLQQINNLRVGGFHGRHVLAFKLGIAPNAEFGWVGVSSHSGRK